MITIGDWYKQQPRFVQILFNLLSKIFGDLWVSEWLGYRNKTKKIGTWKVKLYKIRTSAMVAKNKVAEFVDLPPQFYGKGHDSQAFSKMGKKLDELGFTAEEKIKFAEFCDMRYKK